MALGSFGASEKEMGQQKREKSARERENTQSHVESVGNVKENPCWGHGTASCLRLRKQVRRTVCRAETFLSELKLSRCLASIYDKSRRRMSRHTLGRRKMSPVCLREHAER